jgi:Protein of unknown function (DUF3108)
MRSLHHSFAVAALFCAAMSAQTVQKPAPAAAAPKLTGFPFQDESLRYSIKWPSGLSLGDVTFGAHHGGPGWTFDLAIDAGVPGFTISDRYHSAAAVALCSTELQRDISHGGRKTTEKTTFDQQNRTAHRVTVVPEGGKSDFDLPSCAKDALTFLYFAREELGQGRVAPPQQVFLGAGYSVVLKYTGEATVRLDDKPSVTDRVVVSVKGPKADVNVEAYFARDAARTPLLVKLPLSMGTFSMELVR